MTHQDDLFLFLITNRSCALNRITFQARIDGLFVQILPLNFMVTAKTRAQMASLREQRCLWNLKVGWLFLPELMARFAILVNYEVFTFPIMSTSDVVL